MDGLNGEGTMAVDAWRAGWRIASWWAWPVVTGLAITANVIALPQFARAQLTPAIRAELPGWHLTPAEYVATQIAYSAVFMLVCLAVSAVIYFRAAAEPVARLCAYMLVGLGFGIGGFLLQLTITNPVANAVSVIVSGTAQVLDGWFFLVFPSGRFVPRWSRWCLLAAGAGIVVASVPSIVRIQPVSSVVQAIGLGLLVLGAGAQVYRYRRVSAPAERQQTKWVAYGVAACMVMFFSVDLVLLLVSLAVPSARHSQVGTNIIVSGIGIIAFSFIPVCIGIAVLRTRLWDVGLVVSRTLTYAVVTGLLVTVYAGLVLLATRVLSVHTPVAVAASTLAAAAIFHPLRRRVQHAVDRRFNRARYDADKAVTAFAAQLQDTAGLDAVQAGLLTTVHEALEPKHVSIWIARR
jgi:hypothetical protein